MLDSMPVMSNGSEGINTQYIEGFNLSSNSTKNITIDVSKTYLLFFTVLNSNYVNYEYCSEIVNGVKTDVKTNIDTIVSISGTTLSISNGSSLNGVGMLISLN